MEQIWKFLCNNLKPEGVCGSCEYSSTDTNILSRMTLRETIHYIKLLIQPVDDTARVVLLESSYIRCDKIIVCATFLSNSILADSIQVFYDILNAWTSSHTPTDTDLQLIAIIFQVLQDTTALDPLVIVLDLLVENNLLWT